MNDRGRERESGKNDCTISRTRRDDEDTRCMIDKPPAVNLTKRLKILLLLKNLIE